MFHRGWKHVEGRIIDRRMLPHKHVDQFTGGVDTSPHMHECVVEFEDSAGRRVRLKVTQTIEVVLPANGEVVPLLVKPDDSEAVFDKHDPRINLMAVVEAERKAEKERLDSQLDQ